VTGTSVGRWLGKWRRALATLGTTYRGSVVYLQSALVALVLAPVVPDILVDLTAVEGRSAAAVRLGGVLLVVAVCALVFVRQSRRYRRSLSMVSSLASNVRPHDTLIIALSLGMSTRYEQVGARVGRLPSITEILVDRLAPRTVILVRSQDVPDREWRTTRDSLQADGLQVATIMVHNSEKPEEILADVQRALSRGMGDGQAWDLSSVAVDVTGGTKLMSLAMLRLAAELDASCVYVTKRYAHGRAGIAPNSQVPYQFDPRQLVEVVP
jgi:CRISPR-associated protein (Cas_Cas02710)